MAKTKAKAKSKRRAKAPLKRKKGKAKPKVVEPEVIEAELVEDGVDFDPGEPEITALDIPGARVTAVSLPAEQEMTGFSALATFLSDKHEKTVRKYHGSLGDFAGWLGWKHRDEPYDEDFEDPRGGVAVTMREIGMAIEAISRASSPVAHDLALRYRAYLLARGQAPNTINRKLSALRSCLKTAKVLGVCPWDLSVPNVEEELVRDTAGPGLEGYRLLDEAASNNVAEAQATLSMHQRSRKSAPRAFERAQRKLVVAVRDQALLTLWFQAGMRRAEPLTCNADDVDLKDHKRARLRFLGKKRRAKAWFDINARCAKDLAAWVKLRDDSFKPLFYSTHPSHYGKRLNERSMNKMLAALCKQADVEATPHGLRHAVATELLERTGGDVRAVADFLRHKDLSVVQKYDDNRKKHARRMGNLLDED